MYALPLINLSLLVLSSLSLCFYAFSTPEKSEPTPLAVPTKPALELPPSPFQLEKSQYEAIGKGSMQLKWVSPTLELPDLRSLLLFYGPNGRLDRKEGKFLMHFALKEQDQSKTIEEDTPIYLHYKEGKYQFSPDNQPTSLWIRASSQNGIEAEITVFTNDEKKRTVITPQEFHSFTLQAQEFKLGPKQDLEIEGHRVDGGFFMRQHARLIGKDLFFAQHGGEEYKEFIERERLDFQIEEKAYSCFVKEGDLLIWKKGRWHVAKMEEDTTLHPLLVLKKLDDRSALFEYWQEEGKAKLPLNLMRHKAHDPVPMVTEEFKFVGAKTWAQFIIECSGKRFIVRNGDWLLLKSDGWHKISSSAEVDAYVDQTLKGPLFVLDKMVKEEGRQSLIGHIFNASRTDVKEVELNAFNKEKAEGVQP